MSTRLEDGAEVHRHDLRADLTDDVEVVGDEEVGEAPLPLQLGEEQQHLRLDGDVKSGDRLVELLGTLLRIFDGHAVDQPSLRSCTFRTSCARFTQGVNITKW